MHSLLHEQYLKVITSLPPEPPHERPPIERRPRPRLRVAAARRLARLAWRLDPDAAARALA